MLHEILLSLSGHPSPLLRNEESTAGGQPLLSAPERELLKTAAHISELHCSLIQHTTHISATHPSVICRAVSTAVSSVHLAAFQRKILEVEDGILRQDASLVGAYNIVPLTAALGEFTGWTRRLEWLWALSQFMLKKRDHGPTCRGAELMNKLRAELQTGYADIEATSLSLIQVAETAWLKQVSAWVLYGRLPGFGADDFFVQKDSEDEQGYKVDPQLLPSFVSGDMAASMLFIGTSLHRVRDKGVADPTLGALGHLSSQIQELSALTYPLSPTALSRAIMSIRLHLSRTVLQKLLPLEKVLEMLQVLRQFMLLGRGEFAMALTQQADEKIRDRWRRADNLAYEKRDGLGTINIKEGEVAAVLARTWVALGSMQSQHAGEDEELELARELLQLNLSKSKASTGLSLGKVVATPFRNLLLSVPVDMTVRIYSPLDLFLSRSDMQTYTSINSYLLSIRRAHLRLTDLWKVTRLRRHHLAPPRPPFSSTQGGIAKTKELRKRWSTRATNMRSAWTTSSASIFFLAEIEAYLQVEVVEGLWDDFQSWLTGKREETRPGSESLATYDEALTRPTVANHDPQSLSIAHQQYLQALVRRLLLTQAKFTEPLYNLLIQTDHLVALIYRLDGIWTSMDLEADEGVVDAFSNLEAEESDVQSHLREVESKVKKEVEEVVRVLRDLSMDSEFLAEMEDEDPAGDSREIMIDEGEGRFKPKRIGGVDRLLMKLDFGRWFDAKE
ncbi:hypothetical protein JX266_004308 [Neoarthrinium moseri]|nr:hypothetical protein JX266_004308 [Neoarthrinium moseri]